MIGTNSIQMVIFCSTIIIELEALTKRCGNREYNPNASTCCRGILTNGKGLTCCGNIGFDPSKKTCCYEQLVTGAKSSCLPLARKLNMNIPMKDYKKHPCRRDCNSSSQKMLCEYDFNVEWYATMSKACFDCPYNMTHCSRPDCIAANGVERVLIGVNRMMPGPAIEVCKNDIISVYVHNNLHMGESTSIHWHGIRQMDTPYYDGAAMLTQCPIQPHTFFQYKFKAQTATTTFWHSHSAIQRGDGMQGPLIIRQKAEDEPNSNRYDFDLSEHVVFLSDWLNDTIISKFVSSNFVTRNQRIDSILINGKGVKESLVNNQSVKTPRAVFTVKKEFRYRFRVINAGVLYCPKQLSIDNHKLEVISIDGNSVDLEIVDAIFLQSAERVDFVLTANNTEDNYWIKIKGFGDCADSRVFETAILNYASIAVKEPLDHIDYTSIEVPGKHLEPFEKDVPGVSMLMHVDLHGSVTDENKQFYKRIKQKPDKKFFIGLEYKLVNNPEYNSPMFYSMNMVTSDKQFFTPQVNKISLKMPASPLLYQWNDLPKVYKYVWQVLEIPNPFVFKAQL